MYTLERIGNFNSTVILIKLIYYSSCVNIKRGTLNFFLSFYIMIINWDNKLSIYFILSLLSVINNCICTNVNMMNVNNEKLTDNSLEKFVKLFSMPGAFNRVNEIFGDNSINIISTLCPDGDDGINCRRAEARRSLDCPTGNCYCYNCAVAGAELWPSCCRENAKCCSHLAAACRNCDHSILISFCSKHFNKCLTV